MGDTIDINKLKQIKRICSVCKYQYSIIEDKCPKCGSLKEKSVTYLLESMDNEGDVIKEQDYKITWREVRALVTPNAGLSNYRDAIIEAHNMVEKAVMAFFDNKQEYQKMDFMSNLSHLREKGIYLNTKGLSIAKRIRNDCVHKNRVVLKEKLNYSQTKLAIDEYGKALVDLGVLPKEEYYINKDKSYDELAPKSENKEKDQVGDNIRLNAANNVKNSIAMFMLGTGVSGIIFLVLNLMLK